ncbi:M48 family metallopeptidase [Microbispora rosea]|uniref:M48 family metallopeptidase n=1 Tax=Microbispora rosea TaxID=58117 RepID=UPI003794C4D4
MRSRPEPPTGLPLPADRAPMLWATVRELEAEARTRIPEEIWLTAEVNAAVQEESRLLGLAGGRRRLYVGLPLLQTMTVGQMRAVLAHARALLRTPHPPVRARVPGRAGHRPHP